jgi:hypothetical protein
MKLTNKQLKQIIKEELSKVLEAYIPPHHIRPPEFDSRSGQNYPEYEEKLRNLYMSDDGRDQARELAGALEEPIDIPVDASRTEDDLTFPIFDKSKRQHFGVRYNKDGVEFQFGWDPKQQKYEVSFQLPYNYPGGGGGNGGFSYFDDYEKAKERYSRN